MEESMTCFKDYDSKTKMYYIKVTILRFIFPLNAWKQKNVTLFTQDTIIYAIKYFTLSI